MANVQSETPTNFALMVLIESPTKKLHHSCHHLFSEDDPERLAIDIQIAYREHVGRFKRLFQRGVLLKKPIVSIAKLSKVTTVGNSFGGEERFFIQSKVYDPTLTSAIRNPAILRNIDRDSFFRDYKDVIVEADGPAPQAAILIHLVTDPTASKAFGIVGSVVSVTLGLVGAFVL